MSFFGGPPGPLGPLGPPGPSGPLGPRVAARDIAVLDAAGYAGCSADQIRSAVSAGYTIVDLRATANHALSPWTATRDRKRISFDSETFFRSAGKFWNSRKVFQNENCDMSKLMDNAPSRQSKTAIFDALYRPETSGRGHLLGWSPEDGSERLYQRDEACNSLFVPAYAAQLEALDLTVRNLLADLKIAIVDDPCSKIEFGASVAVLLQAMLRSRAEALDSVL